MSLITALALSIGTLGGVATWLFVGPAAALGLQIWAAFNAWAAYYHSGGKNDALKSNIPAHIWGAFLGWVGMFGITQLGDSLGVPLAAGLCVGITVIVLVLGAKIPALAQIPSAVYGYTGVAAFTLLAGKLDTLTSASINDNPFINIVVSMVVGALFGWLSEQIASALAAKPAEA
jgi:hypothetical protein